MSLNLLLLFKNVISLRTCTPNDFTRPREFGRIYICSASREEAKKVFIVPDPGPASLSKSWKSAANIALFLAQSTTLSIVLSHY